MNEPAAPVINGSEPSDMTRPESPVGKMPPPPRATVYTTNTVPDQVWITIYDQTKTSHLDWGWMGPAPQGRTWTAGNYVEGGTYYVRGQIVDSNSNNLGDTTIQIESEASTITVTLMLNSNGYYWTTS